MSDEALKISPLHIAVAIACGRTEPFMFGTTIPGLITNLLATSRHWEQMEKVREKHGMESESPPFHSTVMSWLARVNELRVAAQREEMRRRMEQNATRAKIARRRKTFRPHVSRRVENERRERIRSEITAGEEGPSGPVLSGSGVE